MELRNYKTFVILKDKVVHEHSQLERKTWGIWWKIPTETSVIKITDEKELDDYKAYYKE